MVQIREATSKLRLVLAEIKGKEDQLDVMIRQFRTQLTRLSRQAIYGRVSVDLALASMGEVQERLSHSEGNKQNLMAIKQKAADELSALELTQRVEEAKESLRDLKLQATSDGRTSAQVTEEVRRLEEFIAENSKRAERAITSSFQDNVQDR